MPEEEKSIIDIKNVSDEFKKLKERLDVLDEGFRAVGSDYWHHIEISQRNKHEIFELKDNIVYRYFSARFHLQLIIQQHQLIIKRFSEILKTDPGKILNEVYPVNPNFDYAEKEISSILDSIIFHVGSVFDYLSILVNFVCNSKSDKYKKIKWTQLTQWCRDKSSTLGKLEISKLIDNIDKELVNKLFEYRSELIHKSGDQQMLVLKIKFKPTEADIDLNFLATHKIVNKFSELKKANETHEFSVIYIIFWLLHKSIDLVAKILLGLKYEMETRSTFPKHVHPNDLLLIYVDPETKRGLPASKIMWDNFDKKINTNKESFNLF